MVCGDCTFALRGLLGGLLLAGQACAAGAQAAGRRPLAARAHFVELLVGSACALLVRAQGRAVRARALARRAAAQVAEALGALDVLLAGFVQGVQHCA